jgi:hypothetical protein
MMGVAFNNSKIGSKFSDKQIKILEGLIEISHRDLARYVFYSIYDGIATPIINDWPNTHTWKSPNVERWYPFR